ncbi:MAG: prolipoprotein diacylglyceryl transferase family protein [Bacteroidota bacterium]
MLPYFRQPSLSLGPFTIHAFGVLVACAVLVGVKILHRRAAAQGLEAQDVSRFVSWVLLGGFAGAHLVDRFVYFPADTLAHPISILRFWEGLSSFGGFLGGTAGALWFFHRYAAPGTAWKYLESFAYGFPFGWIFGRLGCFVAFDHPGRETQFFLAQTYKDGIVRHNLGLDEALYTMLIAGIFYLLGRKKRQVAFFMSLLMILYAPFRFAVDFLRTVDVRYLGLTPGQYGCIGLIVLGALILRAHRQEA